MRNSYDGPHDDFLLLASGLNQHLLRPTGVNVPGGWTVVHAVGDRQRRLDLCDVRWTELRPTALGVDGAP
ncbi:MbtH family NRPS accessory protein [Micromonospora sp. NPDC051925]|uniref:MbtH family NRPS accessory protein n=1 Tax=Micromonospora sp. NPDC051925 TaxID=3364288 RepID=UPI0037C9E1D6